MFEKSKLNREIKRLEKEITTVERKRERSQAALVEAILTHTAPKDDDVDFFNRYTAEIDQLRTEMLEYKEKLKQL